MAVSAEQRSITLEDDAYQRLLKAKKQGESISEVILRLTSTKLSGLKRRGEQEIQTSDERKLSVSVEQDLCMGAESCVTLAPAVFALDDNQLGRRSGTEPLGMMEVEAGTVSSDEIIRAAKSCPYQAIRLRDTKTGDQLAP